MSRQLTPHGRAQLGSRASAWIDERGISSVAGRLLVPDQEDTPRGVAHTLARVCGAAQTYDRGEVCYWLIPDNLTNLTEEP